MKLKIILFIAIVFLTLTGCKKTEQKKTEPPLFTHSETNGVYYWKTVLDLDSSDYDLIEDLDLGRIYLRMFDVDIDTDLNSKEDRTIPIGTLRVPYETYNEYQGKMQSVSFVPVVYITLDALKDSKDKEETLAKNIVERVKNMCSYNKVPNVRGLQLDCDWTASTEESFFKLCEKVRTNILKENLPWELSSTIRLHQLSRKTPPVDYGVLMVYNTGSFSDPDEKNSIISEDNVRPYLKNLKNYPLHLDVAYPTYSWQLIFRKRQFIGLLNDIDLNDSTSFSPKSENQYVALKDVPYNSKTIFKGDIVKQENSNFEEIAVIKNKIENILKDKPHSNILYHFDKKNLNNYTYAQLKKILSNNQNN